MPLTADNLGWATNGTLRSRDHLAVIEPYQNRAICGVAIVTIQEIRPRTSVNWCPKCHREARKLGIEPSEVGIENDLETVRRDEPCDRHVQPPATRAALPGLTSGRLPASGPTGGRRSLPDAGAA